MSSSSSEPKPKYPKPYLETPYVSEMFGELYFRVNPSAPPITMSDLFGDFPKAKPKPSDSAFVCEMFGELLFKENPSSPVSISDLFPDFPKPLPKPENEETCINEEEDKKASKKDAPMLVQNELVVANIYKPEKAKPRLIYSDEPLIIDGRVFPPPITSLRQVNNGKPLSSNSMSKTNGGSSSSEDINVPPNGASSDGPLCG